MNRLIKVFLSYSSEDGEIAEKVRRELSASGLSALSSFFSLAAGDSIRTAIKAEISACDFLIVLLSPAALQSSWVKYELETASNYEWRQRAITVIPMKVQPCKVPTYMATWPIVDATRDFTKGIHKLIELLGSAPLVNLDNLTPSEFEYLVVDLLKAYRFKKIRRSSSRADYGYDLVANLETKDPFGRPETSDWLIDIRSRQKQTDISALRSFMGAVKLRGESVHALFITRSQLTSAAREWLEDLKKSSGLRLSVLEGTDLIRLILPKPKLVWKHFGRTQGGSHA